MNWSLSDPCNLLLLLFISWCASSSSSFHSVHFGIVSNSSSLTHSLLFFMVCILELSLTPLLSHILFFFPMP